MHGIQPTVTQRVRGFLTSQGVEVRPWSGLDETYAELYSVLARRRDDPSFWPALEALLQELVDRALDPTAPRRLAAPDAELLASWDVESLVRDLRKALPSGEVPAGYAGVKRFAAGLSSAVLGGFLVLGLAAAGCVGDDGPGPDGGDAPDAGGDAGGDTVVGGECGDGPAILSETIDAMDGTALAKERLCRCVSGLNDSWGTGLAELFETGTAGEIAAALDRLAECCVSGGPGLDTSYEAVEQTFLEGVLCDTSAPAYKGVSFES